MAPAQGIDLLAIQQFRRALAEAGLHVSNLEDDEVLRLSFVLDVRSRPIGAAAEHDIGGAEPEPEAPPLAAEPVAPVTAREPEPEAEEEPHLCEACMRSASAHGTPLVAAEGAA